MSSIRSGRAGASGSVWLSAAHQAPLAFDRPPPNAVVRQGGAGQARGNGARASTGERRGQTPGNGARQSTRERRGETTRGNGARKRRAETARGKAPPRGDATAGNAARDAAAITSTGV